MIVELSKEQVAEASGVGAGRQNMDSALGYRDGRATRHQSSMQIHMDGAIGEYAVHSSSGRAWTGRRLGCFKSVSDVEGAEVRTTRYGSGGLLLKPADDPNKVFILVILTMNEDGSARCRIVGAMLAGDGMKPKYWRTDIPVPAWIVPQRVVLGGVVPDMFQ